MDDDERYEEDEREKEKYQSSMDWNLKEIGMSEEDFM